MPNFSVNASASSADSGAVPEVTARTLARSSRVQIGMQHHPQRGRHQRYRAGRCSRTASAQRSSSNRSSSTNGLASAMHCNTRKTPPICTSGELTIATPRRSFRRRRRPVGFRTHHAARQHVVGEVDAFGRTGRAAGQHPHRDTGPDIVVGTAIADRDQSRRRQPGRAIVTTVVPGRRDQRRQVVGLADDQRQSQRGDIGSGAVVAAGRVDDHHCAAVSSTPSNAATCAGPVAQQHPDLRLLRCRPMSEPIRVGHSPSSTPGEPLAARTRWPARRARRSSTSAMRWLSGCVISGSSVWRVATSPRRRPVRPCRSGCPAGCRSVPGPSRLGRACPAIPRSP